MGLLIGMGDTKPMFPYDYYYGIEWDTQDASPECKRIGNLQLHVSLPVQSQMRRCILNDDGKVVYYLHSSDSTKRDTGAAANLDGSDGQVMVELPEYYYRCEMEGTKRRYLMSTQELPGFTYVPKKYVSAYEATIERSTKKLSSVMNKTEEYRGGNNQAEWDGSYRSQLGMPVTNLSLANFRTYARNRGAINWNCYTYDIAKTIFWFFTVEYANFNHQADYKTSLDSQERRQGGLGKGVVSLTTTNWKEFNQQYPIISCGYTNALGNITGTVPFIMPIEYGEDGLVMDVPSYRGLENPFGHIWKSTDGCTAIVNSEEGTVEVYVSDYPTTYENREYLNGLLLGNLPNSNGFIEEIIYGDSGDLFPKKIGGTSNTYFSASYYLAMPETGIHQRLLLLGGTSSSNLNTGFFCANINTIPLIASYIGSRLTYYTHI